jgi:hypothetical protein
MLNQRDSIGSILIESLKVSEKQDQAILQASIVTLPPMLIISITVKGYSRHRDKKVARREVSPMRT